MSSKRKIDGVLMPRLLARVGREPCPGCAHYDTCKNELLACEAFRLYVMGYRYRGPDRAPSHALYVKVFREDDHYPEAEIMAEEAVV